MQGILELMLRDGYFAQTGIQLYVSLDGSTVYDGGVGTASPGRSLTGDTVIRYSCALKPITGIAVAILVDGGVVSLDDPIARYLDPSRHGSSAVSLRQLLTHTACLADARLSPLQTFLTRALLEEAQARAARLDPARGHVAMYSVHLAWQLAAAVVEAVTGCSFREFVTKEILAPLDLVDDMWLGMRPDVYERLRHRIGVSHVTGAGDTRAPVLLEADPLLCCQTFAGAGGYATARGVGRLYEALLSRTKGTRRDSLTGAVRLVLAPHRRGVHDITEGAVLDYGLGMRLDLASYDVSTRLSADSFGHTGNYRSAAGLADPATGLVLVAAFNDVISSSFAAARLATLIDHVAVELGLPMTRTGM